MVSSLVRVTWLAVTYGFNKKKYQYCGHAGMRGCDKPPRASTSATYICIAQTDVICFRATTILDKDRRCCEILPKNIL